MHTANLGVLKYRAFTLIELLVSMALLATLLFFVIPFGSSLHQKNQVQIIQDDINSAVRFAKTHANTGRHNVILTPLQGSDDWSKGMSLFDDNTKHHEKVIHQWYWKPSAIHVRWRGFQSSRYLFFSADASQNAVNGTFFIEINSKCVVKLVINKLGRIKTITAV